MQVISPRQDLKLSCNFMEIILLK